MDNANFGDGMPPFSFYAELPDDTAGQSDTNRPDIVLNTPSSERAGDPTEAGAPLEQDRPDIDITIPPAANVGSEAAGAQDPDIIARTAPTLGNLSSQPVIVETGAAADLPANSGDGSDHDDPPPPDIPEAELDHPDTGETLRQVINVIDNSADLIESKVGWDIADNRHQWLPNSTAPLTADPRTLIAELANTDPARLGQLENTHIEERYRHTQAQFGDMAEAAGVKIVGGVHFAPQLELHMADPASFSEALGQLERPNAGYWQESSLNNQLPTIIDSAVVTAGVTAIKENLGAATEICGGELPGKHLMFFLAGRDRTPPTDADKAFAASLAEHARPITEGLTNVGAPGHLVDAMDLLATAQQEGKTLEYAIGFGLNLIGQAPEMRLGADHYVNQDEWNTACDYLQHLRRTAPDAKFTRAVRDTVLDAIDHALTRPDPTLLDMDIHPEEIDSGGHDLRQESVLRSAPLLDQARARILEIFS